MTKDDMTAKGMHSRYQPEEDAIAQDEKVTAEERCSVSVDSLPNVNKQKLM